MGHCAKVNEVMLLREFLKAFEKDEVGLFKVLFLLFEVVRNRHVNIASSFPNPLFSHVLVNRQWILDAQSLWRVRRVSLRRRATR